MGCSSSSHYPPDIVNLQDIDSDIESKTGNKTSTPTVVRFSDNNNSSNKENAEKMKKDGDVMRGDVTQRHQAKLARQRNLVEKQKKVASAAEELANQVLEEKERLSLTSRSRGTSRATSRTGSPITGTRKHVVFKPQVSEVKSECDVVMADTTNLTTSNEDTRVNS